MYTTINPVYLRINKTIGNSKQNCSVSLKSTLKYYFNISQTTNRHTHFYVFNFYWTSPAGVFKVLLFFIAFGYMISNCWTPHNNCSLDRVAPGSVRIKTILYQKHRHFHTAFRLKFQGQPVAILKKVDRLWSDYMSSNFIKLPETRWDHRLIIAIRHSYWLLVAKLSRWVSRERTCNLPNNWLALLAFGW